MSDPMEKKMVVWCGAFLKHDGKFLFVKRAPSSSWGRNQWHLAGGKMEWGEHPLKALRREVLEETGRTVSGIRLVGIDTMQVVAKGANYHVVQIVYSGACPGGTVKVSDEHTGYAWKTLDEALGMDLVDNLRDFITENRERI